MNISASQEVQQHALHFNGIPGRTSDFCEKFAVYIHLIAGLPQHSFPNNSAMFLSEGQNV